jgi:hypothetical protein
MAKKDATSKVNNTVTTDAIEDRLAVIEKALLTLGLIKCDKCGHYARHGHSVILKHSILFRKEFTVCDSCYPTIDGNANIL